MTDTIALVFKPQQLDYVANVLAQRPYAEVAQLLGEIQQQVAQHNFNLTQPATGQKESPSSGLDGAVGHLNGAGDGVGANGAAAAS